MLWASVTARVPAHRSPAAARAMTTRWSFLPWATPPGAGARPRCAGRRRWLGHGPQAGDGLCHGGQAVALLQAQALGVEDARLPLAQGGADGQGRHHVGNLGGVDGDAPQAAKGLTGLGLRAVRTPPSQETGKPNWRNSSTQALSPWREAASSPWMATGAPVGTAPPCTGKRPPGTSRPPPGSCGGYSAGRRGCASPGASPGR